MHRFAILVLSTTVAMNTYPQSGLSDRNPVAAGRFYSASPEVLERDLSDLFAASARKTENWNVRAIISPHAGYVFSGKTAASAFAAIPADSKFSNIFVIGSSHVMAFDGASVYDAGDYITPLGKITVNRNIATELKAGYRVFRFPVTSHAQEHSLEVQMPFIQHYFRNVPQVVPIIIGTQNKRTISEIAEALRPWFTPDNLFVISSDFSHYPPYREAYEVDRLTADAIVSKKPEVFLSALTSNTSKEITGLATSMCGWSSGLMLLYLAENNKSLEFKKITYCNSGDSNYGNKSEVVGYHAIALIENREQNNASQGKSEPGQYEVRFSKEETERLFRIARNSIEKMLNENKRVIIDPGGIPDPLKKKMGAFVTLKINGNLRGCIGRFISEDPLYEVVNQMAIASAFDDGRFSPLTREEYGKVDIEISVLGPLKKISDISEIVLGKHGIYIKKDFRSGTMLPQVATENHWTVEEFLGYTSREKAGLGWTGWKEAELYIYEAVVLEEPVK